MSGTVAASVTPDELAAAIVRVYRAGPELRESTLDWFHRNAERLSLERSLHVVATVYENQPRS